VELIPVIESEKQTYNHFVANSDEGSFLQSWDWGEWQKTLGREVKRFWLTENDEKIGLGQFVKMPLFFGKFYWYCPYGPIINQNLNIKNQNYLEQVAKQFSGSIFVRIEPKSHQVIQSLNHSIIKSSNIQPGKTLVIDLAKSEEELLSDMHQKTRYNIKVALKHEVVIEDEFALTVGKGLFAQEAVGLIVETAKRQGYMAQGKDYFEKLATFFAVQNPNGDLKLHIYKALWQKQLLTSALIIDFGKTRTYLFGGSSQENKNLMAPYLLHFKAMLDAKSLGLTGYDFWGIETSSGETPGFVKFKMGFSTVSPKIKQYAGAYDLVNNFIAYNIYSVLRWINKRLSK
jgi:lipid II:glycine glycyltransferase (peptidoglycan interpeptide bridge formation enzyme)